ncbi:MAG: ATP-binding cassette domain-containing protein [Bdellovibrionota bacterium]|mgnify:CR=1 FL=1
MSIRFQNVTKSFGLNRVLNNVSFEVKTGEILFIIGKSGVGKSVTLKHIVGLLKPDSGSVSIDGTDVTKQSAEQLSEIRLKCGMVFQRPALLDSLTVFENIAFGLKTVQYAVKAGKELEPKELERIVTEKIRLVNLGHELPAILDKKPPELSFGMQKRVSLARTLAPHPSYLLFDEPTTGLDPITTNAINDLILDLSRKLKVTSIVVSHDMSCALKIADRILVLDKGAILALEPASEIRHSRQPLIMEFLKEEFLKGGAPC